MLDRDSEWLVHLSLVFEVAFCDQWYSHFPFSTGGVIKYDWYISAGAVKRWHVSLSGHPSPVHLVMSLIVLVCCAPHDPIWRCGTGDTLFEGLPIPTPWLGRH
jgi:hypothetical protein